MRKVRRAQSRLGGAGTGSGALYLQGMWRKTKVPVIAGRRLCVCRMCKQISRGDLKQLQRRVGLAFSLEREARLLEVELALDAAARFVGDLAVLQEPVDVFALSSDQFGPQLRGRRHSLEPVRQIARHLPRAMVV